MKKILKIVFRAFIILFLLLNVVTAFHAYKFTHFYDAGSISVKPDSLKSGWQKAKEAFFGINFAKQINSAPDSSIQTVYLHTKSGLKLEAWYGKVMNAKGTVCLFHGHGSKNLQPMQKQPHLENWDIIHFNSILEHMVVAKAIPVQ
jgi:hypothetical protein